MTAGLPPSPADRLADMRDAAEALVAARTDIRPEFIPLPHVPWEGTTKAEALAARFLDFARDPALLDLAESVIGPDIVFWTAALFCKPGGDGRAIPWHQDGVYWPLRPPATVTLWVALDDSRIENGCLRYVPGSHMLGLLRHEQSAEDGLGAQHRRRGERDRRRRRALRRVERRPAVDARDLPGARLGAEHLAAPARRPDPALHAGDLALRPQHQPGTGSNTAPLEFANRPIWLVRGADRAGND